MRTDLIKYLLALVAGIVIYNPFHEASHVLGGLLVGEQVTEFYAQAFGEGYARMTYVP